MEAFFICKWNSPNKNQQQLPLKFENQHLKLIFLNNLVLVLNDSVENLSHLCTGLREGHCLFLICSINLVFKATSGQPLILEYLLWEVQIPIVCTYYFWSRIVLFHILPLNVSLLFSSSHTVLFLKGVLYIQKDLFTSLFFWFIFFTLTDSYPSCILIILCHLLPDFL